MPSQHTSFFGGLGSRGLTMSLLALGALSFSSHSLAQNCTPLGPFGLPGLTGPPDQIGEWSPVYNWATSATHASVLPTGKVLWWRTGEPVTPRIYDPVTNTHSVTPDVGTNMFCAGHASMADGSVLVAGGTVDFTDNFGHFETNRYYPETDTWSPTALMNTGRWYPTVTALANGDVMVSGGTTVPVPSLTYAREPEIYNAETNQWTEISTATRNIGTYPYMFVIPDGRVLHAGPEQSTKALNLKTGLWETYAGASAVRHTGSQGSATMVRPGEVIRMGGGDPATADTEMIKMADANPAWDEISPMQFARRRPDLVLLPTGDAIAVGGAVATQAAPECAVHALEMWSYETKTWTTLASHQRPRIYHSTAVLLPDGRILAAGGENDDLPGSEATAEIFSPPYLFKGPRPLINSHPVAISYDMQFEIEVDDRSVIDSIAVMRPNSVTHNFDQNQRYVPLTFSNGAGPNSIVVTSPIDANHAPPGTYTLYVVNTTGVPSVASFLQINVSADMDVDGVVDTVDNCTMQANADQRDTDGDGFGNVCDADINNDCVVNFADYALFPAAFNSQTGDANYNPDLDFNGDGFINFGDIVLFPQTFLNPPGPGATACVPAN